MALRKIGEAVTGTNGKCVIPYTGVGVGRLQMRGQYEEDGRVIQSGTYEVLDCTFKDFGDNDKWWSTANGGNRSASDGNISFIYSGSSYTMFYCYTGTLPSSWNDKLNACLIFDSPFAVEFKVVEVTDRNNLGVIANNDTASAWIAGGTLNLASGTHIKCVYTGSKALYYIDGVKLGHEKDYEFTESRFCFRLQGNASITINEFKAYPI